MKEARLQRYLERASSVAVILVAITVIYVNAWNFLRDRQKPPVAVGLQTGQAIAGPPTVDYHRAPQTLLIALSTKCLYCQENIPFYKKLTELQASNQTRIIAIFPDEEREVERFLQQNHLEIDTATAVNLISLGITATPALVLVDDTGKVADFWIGSLSAGQEHQVISKVSGRAS